MCAAEDQGEPQKVDQNIAKHLGMEDSQKGVEEISILKQTQTHLKQTQTILNKDQRVKFAKLMFDFIERVPLYI